MVAVRLCCRGSAPRAPPRSRAQPVQAPRDVEAAHHAHPGRRQLDRQRQAVDPSADLGHRAGRLAVELEVRPAGPGPIGEQRGGVLDRQRGDRHDPLTLDAERFPAGGQHRHPRAVRGRSGRAAAPPHPGRARSCRRQQQLARPQILDHRLLDVEALLLLQPQRRRNGVTDRRTVVERRQFADPHTVSEARLVTRGGLKGQPGLADAADPGQRHQRALAHAGHDPADILLPVDEAGRAPRQSSPGQGQ